MPLRIRFVIGKSDTAKESTRSFASAIAREVAFRASEESYKEIKQTISTSLQADAKRELTFLMSLYKRHIIGASANRSKPSGMLRYALGPSNTDVGFDDENYAIADLLPAWAPRSPEYLRQKRRRGWGQTWWSARGDLASQLNADTLLSAYGPIRVSVRRDISETDRVAQRGAAGQFRGARLNVPGYEQHIKLNVATIRVFAMQAITPSMLPALASGTVNAMNSDEPTRGHRFLAPLMAVNAPLAYRLGRLSYETHRYRPTLEPFLAWFLTRAIPNALALRIQQGSLQKAKGRFNVVRR